MPVISAAKSNSVDATPRSSEAAPLDTQKTVQLKPGDSFYDTMAKANGVEELLKKDHAKGETFKVVSGADFMKAMQGFDSDDLAKVGGMFKDGQKGIQAFVDSIKGKEFSPADGLDDEMKTALKPFLKSPSDAGLGGAILSNFIGMASGAGVLVKIDPKNYYYNYGYHQDPGGDPEKTAKSGRSYMASTLHGARDTSYPTYLKDTGSYFKGNPSAFFNAALGALVNGDGSGFAKLDAKGQSVATDFLGIYTAELERNLMVPQHKWMNDLGELTFLSAAYGAAEGKIAKDGKLVDGTPADYDYFNKDTNRSGIGFTRGDRQALQQAVSDYEWKNNPEQMKKLASLIGVSDGRDVIHGLFAYLNDASKQADVKKNAQAIISAASDVFNQMRTDAPKITEAIGKTGLKVTGRPSPKDDATTAPDLDKAAAFIGKPRSVAARTVQASTPIHPSTLKQ